MVIDEIFGVWSKDEESVWDEVFRWLARESDRMLPAVAGAH